MECALGMKRLLERGLLCECLRLEDCDLIGGVSSAPDTGIRGEQTHPPSIHELPRSYQAVEKLPWYSLSPQIGYQTRRFGGVSSPGCGRYQLNADFFNRLSFLSEGR